MYLTEKHIVNYKHSFYKECDELCFNSKNIYNQALFNVRQYFFLNKKYLNYETNYHIVKEQECYSLLPTKVACQTIKMVDKNFKSFFSLLKNKTIKNKIPKYLHKEKGRYLTIFPKQALSIKEFKKNGLLHLSKTNIKINTKVKDFSLIKEVRISPKNNHYCIEIVYEKKRKEKLNNNLIASVDLGLNNLCALTFNNGSQPLLINGKPLKSINQYYNKQRSKLQSKLKNNVKTSKKIQKLTFKRNNKINDYLHKCSHLLVNQLVSKNISTLIIGKNTGMKQDINMGRTNNQNFVQAPLFRFADMLKYKCELEGITFLFQEESYTSKCSFFDNESIEKHDNYVGKRIKRGLFRTGKGMLVNADINGSYNIMKKAIPNAFANGIEVVGVQPLCLHIK